MTDAIFIDEGDAPGILKFPTSFNGTRGPNDAEGYYTPLCSYGDEIGLAENTWAPNTLTGNVARIRKSDHVQIDRVSTGSQSWTPGVGVAVAGHASASVGMDGTSGRLVTRRGGHAQALDARYEATPGTLSSTTTLANPAGGDVRADYRRFWRAPNGTLWMYCRGNDGKGELYKWNDATAALDRVGGAGPFSDYGSGTGSYAANLTFDPVTGDVYAVTEALLTATSGFPAHFIGCVKSTDDGATWTELDGTPVTLPLTMANQTVVAGGTLADQVVAAQIALDASGNPFIIMGWTNAAEGDQFLATWTARWNGTGWDYVRLYEQIGDGTDQLGQWQNSKIIPQIATHDGTMVVVMKEVGETVPQRLVKLVQFPEDDPTTWHRWVLHPDDLYTGAYIDMWSMPDDGLLRVYPVTSGDLVPYDQTSEIWELPVAGVASWGDNVQTDDIPANTHTDTPVESGVYYRYRVAAFDSVTGLQSGWSDWVVVEPGIPEGGVAFNTGTEVTATGETPAVPVPEGGVTFDTGISVAAAGETPAVPIPTGGVEWHSGTEITVTGQTPGATPTGGTTFDTGLGVTVTGEAPEVPVPEGAVAFGTGLGVTVAGTTPGVSVPVGGTSFDTGLQVVVEGAAPPETVPEGGASWDSAMSVTVTGGEPNPETPPAGLLYALPYSLSLRAIDSSG